MDEVIFVRSKDFDNLRVKVAGILKKEGNVIEENSVDIAPSVKDTELKLIYKNRSFRDKIFDELEHDLSILEFEYQGKTYVVTAIRKTCDYQDGGENFFYIIGTIREK